MLTCNPLEKHRETCLTLSYSISLDKLNSNAAEPRITTELILHFCIDSKMFA